MFAPKPGATRQLICLRDATLARGKCGSGTLLITSSSCSCLVLATSVREEYGPRSYCLALHLLCGYSFEMETQRTGLAYRTLLRRILDFEHSRNQRKGSEFFSREVGFMRWFPAALLTNGCRFYCDTCRIRTHNPCAESARLATTPWHNSTEH